MPDKGQIKDIAIQNKGDKLPKNTDFVLDKFIFSNVFEKDIRRIYIYRKSERLAKALQLIGPAFASAPSLRNRIDGVALGLIDSAILPTASAREALSRELLALSSILSMARSGNLLSEMNAELIAREAQILLQEIASYQEPRLFLEEAPTLAELSKQAAEVRSASLSESLGVSVGPDSQGHSKRHSKGHIKDKTQEERSLRTENSEDPQYQRHQAIISALRSKGPSYIKDVATLFRDVSEKTIQRDLQNLIDVGSVQKEGERRWTKYFVA
jgi:hypothetical protein